MLIKAPQNIAKNAEIGMDDGDSLKETPPIRRTVSTPSLITVRNGTQKNIWMCLNELQKDLHELVDVEEASGRWTDSSKRTAIIDEDKTVCRLGSILVVVVAVLPLLLRTAAVSVLIITNFFSSLRVIESYRFVPFKKANAYRIKV
jgi:hypothetical protein